MKRILITIVLFLSIFLSGCAQKSTYEICKDGECYMEKDLYIYDWCVVNNDGSKYFCGNYTINEIK